MTAGSRNTPITNLLDKFFQGAIDGMAMQGLDNRELVALHRATYPDPTECTLIYEIYSRLDPHWIQWTDIENARLVEQARGKLEK
tara:strand:- start:556 stop:810 length:255 start_codon:yes stop_codon:yes gene_type:complete